MVGKIYDGSMDKGKSKGKEKGKQRGGKDRQIKLIARKRQA